MAVLFNPCAVLHPMRLQQSQRPLLCTRYTPVARASGRALGTPSAKPTVTRSANKDYTPRTQPSKDAADIWRNVDACCFDVDCTVTVNDSLDLLAEFLGCGEEVEKLTNQAMDGSLTLQVALERRLNIINCAPADIRRFIKAHPPKSRLAPGIKELIQTLQSRGVSVYLISGGFREMTLPVASYLGVPKQNVYANRMNWQWCDEVGEPAKLVGFDISEPTARNKGKVEAIKQIRKKNPYNNIVMIGDGITDLEAVQSSHGADLFIGYGGIVERPDVASQAEWYVYDHSVLTRMLQTSPVQVEKEKALAAASNIVSSRLATVANKVAKVASKAVPSSTTQPTVIA